MFLVAIVVVKEFSSFSLWTELLLVRGSTDTNSNWAAKCRKVQPRQPWDPISLWGSFTDSSHSRVEATSKSSPVLCKWEKKHLATCVATRLSLLASILMTVSVHFQHTHQVVSSYSLFFSSHTLYPSSLALAAANKDSRSCLSCPAGDVDTQRLQFGARSSFAGRQDVVKAWQPLLDALHHWRFFS